MKRLLIIGCGNVVRRALPWLLPHWRIYALVRHDDPELRRLGVTLIRGDLDQPDSLHRLSGLAQAVLHSAPPQSSGAVHVDTARGSAAIDMRTRRLLAALARRGSLPRRLVYISTSGVYGDCQGEKVSETRPPHPTTLRAQKRQDAEQRLRDWSRPPRIDPAHRRRCRVTLLRAPGIYAADRLPVQQLIHGAPVLTADDDVYTNHIHEDDLARACVAALRYGRANRVVNVCDGFDIKLSAWYDAMATALGLPAPPRLPRAQIATQRSPQSLSFMQESRRLTNTRLKQELHMHLRYPDPLQALSSMTLDRSDLLCVKDPAHALV
jgi:nucleoside-diphosphate-sugar epimerase